VCDFTTICGYGLTLLGALHALAFYMRGSNEDTWSSQFEKVVKDTTHAHANGPTALLERVKRVIRCWTQDGLYDAKMLEDVFQNLYGHKQTLFGWSSEKHAPKIAITGTSIGKRPRTYLFTNYNVNHGNTSQVHANDLDLRPLDYDYPLRYGHQDREPRVWQM
jgi:hypothetical protein